MATSKPKIYDASGRLVDTRGLTEEIATVSLTSIRQPYFPSMADGITPYSLGLILRGTDTGNILDYLTLAAEMEEREPHYASVLGVRKEAVVGCGVSVDASSDDAEDVQIAEEFKASVVDGDSFPAMTLDVLDALGKGFSETEIVWDTSESQWNPTFIYRDPRHFLFDRETSSQLLLRDEADVANGVPLKPLKWIQHRPKLRSGLAIKGGLARLAAVAFMAKGYALKDWLAFAEVFGMPLRLGRYGTNATPEEKAALLSAVANIGTDAAAIVPDSMLIEFIQADKSAGGDKLFQGLADWLDKQTSKAVLGQTMTSDDGSSLAQAQVHNEVRKDILVSDARQLSATLQRDLVRPWVDLNYGQRKPNEYPKLRIVPEEKEDLESLSKSLAPFIDRGLRVEQSVIRDKFSLPEPDEDAEVLTPASKGGGLTTPSPVAPTTEGEPPDAPPPSTARRLREVAVAQLTSKVVAGEALTEDQRRYLELAAQAPDDEVDRLATRALPAWRGVTDPMLEPIIRLAERCKTADEFRAELATLDLDTGKLAETIARLTFTARGLGDATDKT